MHKDQYLFFLLAILLNASVPSVPSADPALLPEGFSDVRAAAPGVRLDLRYLGSDNFLGRPVEGYEATRLVLSSAATDALVSVQVQLEVMDLGLLVYDAYRPQRAVDDFVRWAGDLDDQVNKQAYYPDVDKSELFERGYIAARSGHTRGSTVDVTLVALESGSPLDMGTAWDFFGPESWPDDAGATDQQRANRLLLRTLMMQAGFVPYAQEWWHFTLASEPFPDTYFDFPVR
jgi:D-alanyl-D-alanine dipeptidase